MGPKTTKSSRSSVISIDPVIASQITSPTPPRSSKHTRADSSPARVHHAVTSGYAKGHGRNNSAPLKNQNKRSNSLRRAKNSTDILRQRSTGKDKPMEDSKDTKRGRTFTVTNVGTGGLLYLRPSAHQGPTSPTLSSPPLATFIAPTTTTAAPTGEKDPPLSTTQYKRQVKNNNSRTRSVSPKRLLQRAAKVKEERALRPQHQRSASFSTIDESRKSIIGTWPKTLRIIINRAGAVTPAPDDPESKLGLNISIPHYRLGVPRFSTHGTPILRNSAYSQSSSNLSIKRSSHAKAEGVHSAPPPASLKAFAKLQTLDPSQDVASGRYSGKQRNVDSRTSSYLLDGRISPSIYDDLTIHYNDPAIVRFAHDVRDVTAATPARIIAQISSESFMDYELVSDFFLTFRSYMSTMEVLDLLLARLAWAIGRMSDDGRIIRIRTFAALRHWILNYFMDDFVSNRRMRIRFCDEVNDLYNEVKSKQIGGPSDLKILQDLKRCWNGRCSLYWDGEEFSMDDGQDAEIHPGGVIGSRNADNTDMQEIDPGSFPAPMLMSQPSPAFGPSVSNPTAVLKPQHNRQQASFASSRAADSVHSEQSIQPHSCSIPLRHVPAGILKADRPHPVSVLERRQKAPADLQVVTNRPESRTQHHRRGGNSFDSTRERTPYEAPASATPWVEPYDGSVIRGFVFAPVEPFVQIPPTMPLSPSSAYDLKPGSFSSNSDLGNHLPGGGPAVKNIFGSIRRALGTKPGHGELAMITISAPYSNQTHPGRKSPMLMSTSRSQDELRNKAAPLPPRSPIRIDLLCAACVESYQAHVPGLQNAAKSPPPPEMLKAGATSTMSPNAESATAGTTDMQRVLSHVTAESGSILIVDETGLGITTVSGTFQYQQDQDTESSLNHRSSSVGYEQARHASYATQIAFEDDNVINSPEKTHESPLQSKEGNSAEQEPVGMNPNLNLSTASTTTVKNRPSLNSSNAQLRAKASADESASSVTAPQDYQDDVTAGSQAPAQMLRRMPGGDLRKNQNVHDLEVWAPHHESLDSVANTVSSNADSLVIMSNATPTQAYKLTKMDPNQVSMINTHSSQHLRPSFEAAVAGFSTIPDDDDGGLEATLLKLEGRYESPDLREQTPRPPPSETFSGSTIPTISQSENDVSSLVVHRGYAHQPEYMTDMPLKQITNMQHFDIQRPFNKEAIYEFPVTSTASSARSQDSVPLLHRMSAAVPVDEELVPDRAIQHRSRVTFSPIPGERIKRQELAASPFSSRMGNSDRDLSRPDTARSFLLDEDENLSDLSSEMSVDIINYSEAIGNPASAMLVAPGTAVSGLEIPSHPLAHSSFVNLSMHPSLALDGGPNSLNKPLTPEPSPVVGRDTRVASKSGMHHMLNDNSHGAHIPVGPAHIPFILAYDSQILAQQMTLIEQSGLTEIDWSDLVEMQWSSKPAEVLDWAEYVTQQDIKGVDLVITRFNLMVKWAISEIVLTQDITERVRVITKYIHVAAHARRLRNYATMLQFTIALTSLDCTRLVKTWRLVSAPDKSLLKNMEALIQPIRNFHELRSEMETTDLSDGCIPFIGLYVHDLTYNAQKPAEIDAGKNQSPLVNFERFRTAAVIVKGLLRFIDASSKYDFEPIHGMIERCLWVATLDDERIRTLSKTLEDESASATL